MDGWRQNFNKNLTFVPMKFIKNNLANAFTLANLFSGSIGVIQLLAGNYQITALCIILSLVLDFLDGFIARAMKSDSNLGAQLDSLADMVSFGLLPGLVIYKSLEPFGNQLSGIDLPFEIKYLALFITLFSMIVFSLAIPSEIFFCISLTVSGSFVVSNF